ncbi:hypothetical protein [Paracoccus sp. SJTW-4]|uniref:hypothetical protein n=1 Tax=Paracoccus sp. SJTW-4 TaxID=3078428 RepID=UPI0039EA02E9
MTNKIFADNDTDLWYWGRPRLRPSAHIKRTPDSGAAEIGPKSISVNGGAKVGQGGGVKSGQLGGGAMARALAT